MTTYVALLRAVNVGGTGKLPMSGLRAMCEAAGFEHVRTYIASGNVVFESASSARQVKDALQAAMQEFAGSLVDVHVRTGPEMQAVLGANPFPDAAPNRTVAIFLDQAPPADTLDGISGRRDEQIALGKREIYVHYGAEMGQSKLKIRAAKTGTARNMNTVAKLVEMSNS
ncbi:MAG: DUF1697 domain-containing protein [Rhodanobacter sp.]